MKQMRSRFRLLTLLLACAFLLVLVVCSGRILRESGISLSSLIPSSVPGAESPDPSVSPDSPAETPAAPDPGGDTAPGSIRELLQGTDNTPDPEYNTEGL